MINSVHIIVYSTDAEADRAFIRDVLGFPGVDAGGGWLMKPRHDPGNNYVEYRLQKNLASTNKSA